MKRTVIIWLTHFIITVACMVGTTYEMVEAVREGAGQVGYMGTLLQHIALVVTQPAASTVIQIIPKESSALWLILFLNSGLWAVIVNLVWSKTAGKPK